MTPDMMAKLRRSLEDWISEQFIEDMKYFYEKFSEDFFWFVGLNEDRQAALIELAAFMGYKNLCGLTDVLFSLEIKDFKGAAMGLIDDKLLQQTKGRADRIADIIATGAYGT